jgi:hypothetical protein
MGKFDKYEGRQTNLPAIEKSKLPQHSRADRRNLYTKIGNAVGRSDEVEQSLNFRTDFAICLDATGSMSPLIDAARSSLRAIVERVMREAKTTIRLRLFVYRDYDVPSTALLEKSPLSSDPEALIQWLNKIDAYGGGGNDGEAIELPLRTILAEGSHAAVLIAGDEPPNSRHSLNDAGKYQELTALDLAKVFGEKKVPIYTFVVGENPRTARDFKQMSASSGGQSGKLDGSQEMIDMAVMAILDKLSGPAAVSKYAAGTRLTANSENFKRLLLSGPSKSPSR